MEQGFIDNPLKLTYNDLLIAFCFKFWRNKGRRE
jgi:hypothetical protein